jgi:hypothetical protein
MKAITMISFGKIAASVTLASLLAAGSAYALLKPAGERLPMHNHFAVPFTHGLAARDAASCAIGDAPTNILATLENRWNGQWLPARRDLHGLARTSCFAGWAQGYVSPEGRSSTAANGQAINLSTLPLMR